MATSKKNITTGVPVKTAPSDKFFSGLLERVKQIKKIGADESGALQLGADEGQLAVDVAQNDKELVIMATIAGARPEDISINIFNDLLTIRGKRHHEQEIKQDDYFYRECFWGSFSRTIVLPVDVLTVSARATLKNGVLTIRIPKASPQIKVPLKVIED
ncbi:MAG: Hsp20/alpha crystallin family protein [Candidatus Magasanikbacteria bacterium]|nr:Hsp20/alpha crystallin family protein [Candidatus Magasanikbacteria bacterium]